VRCIPALALLLPLLAAGCGAGDSKGTSTDSDTPRPGPPSKASFIQLADAICRNHQSRREDLESQAASLSPLTSPRKAREVADLLRQESSNLRSELRELEARRPQAPDLTLESLLSLLRTRAVTLDLWARAYDDLDEAAIRRVQVRVGALAVSGEQRARRYGFTTCGQ
jgi:hypothetical protein